MGCILKKYIWKCNNEYNVLKCISRKIFLDIRKFQHILRDNIVTTSHICLYHSILVSIKCKIRIRRLKY